MMTVVNRGEIPGSGGFSYDIDEYAARETGCYRAQVHAPIFYAQFMIAQGGRDDDARVQWLIEKAADEVVDLILQNPLVAERVERLVDEAHNRGFDDGMPHSYSAPRPRMGW